MIVCMYARMYVCMHVQYACMYVMHVCMYVCLHACTVCMHVCNACMHVCIGICISLFSTKYNLLNCVIIYHYCVPSSYSVNLFVTIIICARHTSQYCFLFLSRLIIDYDIYRRPPI